VEIIKWCDNHSGSLSVLIFFATLLIGWAGGFFQYVRHRPKFTVKTIEGPTFVTVVPHDTQAEGRSTHRVAISLYLSIVNIGSAASSIDKIVASYRVPPTSFKAIFKSRWFEIKQTAALQEFSHNIGEHLKIYPFLNQQSFVFGTTGCSYYRVGEASNGIVYYEALDLAWGCHRPILRDGRASIRLELHDSYGKRHRFLLAVPEISIEDARVYSVHIGKTYLNLENQKA
jgi:hypothetical protein